MATWSACSRASRDRASDELVEGVLDLAFEEAGRWMVIDFKTDAELAGELQRYRRQVALYASVVARTTEKDVTAVLMQL